MLYMFDELIKFLGHTKEFTLDNLTNAVLNLLEILFRYFFLQILHISFTTLR